MIVTIDLLAKIKEGLEGMEAGGRRIDIPADNGRYLSIYKVPLTNVGECLRIDIKTFGGKENGSSS